MMEEIIYNYFILGVVMKKFFTLLTICLILFSNDFLSAEWSLQSKIVRKPAKCYTTEPNAKGIVAVDNFVHIVWYDSRDGNKEIYYMRSVDNATSWEADTRLTNNFGESSYPSLAANASSVHIVWNDDSEGDYQIYYKHSTDAGTSWENEIIISGDESSSSQPSIAVFDNYVYVTWYAQVNDVWDIFYNRSTDGGATWEEVTRLTNDASDSFFSSITASDNFVHIVWSEYRDGDEEIYYKRSIDNGATWSPDTRLTNSPGYSDYPSISCSGTLVVATWYDFRNGSSDIYYIRSTNNGETWLEDKQLNSEAGDHVYANVVVSGSFIHVVWNNNDIFYNYSSDAGETWQEETNLSNNNQSYISSVAAFGTTVHVIWRSYQNEMYYKNNPTGNIVGVEENNPITNLFRIFPNPASDYISISNVYDSSSEVNIYNAFGQNVLKSNSTENIDLRELPVGIYYLLIYSGNKIEKTNFVIMR
jgi:predicted neuraminidase